MPETVNIHNRQLPDEAAQFLRRQRFSLADQLTRHLDLVPHIAHHHPPDFAITQVVDDAGIVFLLPVGEGLQPGINLAGRLVTELEQVGEKIRLIGVRFMCAGHIPPRPFPLIEGVIPVLDAHWLPQYPVREKCIVSGGINIRFGSLEIFIHYDTVAHFQTAALGQLQLRDDAHADDHDIRLDHLALPGAG
jgi:hypothetical protein